MESRISRGRSRQDGKARMTVCVVESDEGRGNGKVSVGGEQRKELIGGE